MNLPQFGTSTEQLVLAKTAIIYGDSATTKTTQGTFFAKYYYAKTGRPVRLISAEDSSKILFESLIRAGIVDAVYMTKVEEPLPFLRRLSQGLWPVAKGNAVEWVSTGKPSAYFIEGLTSLSESLADNIKEKGRMPGEQKNVNFVVDGMNFNKLSLQGYGFVQDEMLRNVMAFASIPGIERVLWSSHEVKSEDSDKQAIRGPALIGVKKTADIQKYCGILIHADAYPKGGNEKDKAQETEIRLWYKRHTDRLYPLIQYPAKVTVPPTQVKQFEARFPNGYIVPSLTSGIEQIFEEEEKLLGKLTEDDMNWKKEIDKRFNKE